MKGIIMTIMSKNSQQAMLKISVLILFVLSGCSSYKTISSKDLEEIVNSSSQQVSGHMVRGWYYMGTDNGYHHYKRSYVGVITNPRSDLYKVPQESIKMSIPLYQGVVSRKSSVARIFGEMEPGSAYYEQFYVIDKTFDFQNR